MAANDVKPQEVQNKVLSPKDASEAAKAKAAQEAHDKMLRESQAAKPLTDKEKATLSDTEQLAHGIIKSFTDQGATAPQANLALNQFVNARDDAGRAKVFTDANLPVPDIVKAYEAKYGASTSDAIRSSVLLAKRVEQEQKAGSNDRTQVNDTRVQDPAPTSSGDSPASILNKANSALAKSLEASKAVQSDGKPLSDSAKQIFQAAIDANSKITPAIISAQREALYGGIPGWTPEKENQYRAVNNGFVDAQNNLSDGAKATLAKLPAGSSLEGQVKAVGAMTDDPSAQKFKQAYLAGVDFYKANPQADDRDKISDQLELLSQLSHGKAFASAIYATALARTDNAADMPQARAIIAEAAKDKDFADGNPQFKKAYDTIMGTARPASAAADPLDGLIPGWTQTKAAVTAISDPSLSPEQRILKAAPLFESALNAAKSIKPEDIDAAKAKISAAVSDMTGGRAKSLGDLDNPKNADLVKEIEADPTKNAQAIQLIKQDKLLDRTRQQNLIVSEAYAQALSKTASELQAQANRDPANSAKFNSDANALTEKAVTVLTTLGQTDPSYGVAIDSSAHQETAKQTATLNQKRIEEEIAQVNRGESIDPQKAAGKTGAQFAADTIKESIMGHEYKFQTSLFGQDIDGSLNISKTIRPLEVGVNTTIEALDFAQEHVPVAGQLAGLASEMMKGVLPSPDKVMPNAVKDLAKAKVADPAAANAVMTEKKESAMGNAVSLGSDLVSGQIGVLSAKAAPGLIAKALPGVEETALKAALESGNWKIKLGAATTVGIAAAFGSRWATDELSHDLLGTKRMSVGELASHSTAALAAAYTARGLTSAMPATEGTLAKKLAQTALTSGPTSTVFGLGEVNPFVTNKATGQHYTAADTLMNAGENLAFGATTGMAGRAVAPYVHFSTIGAAKGIGAIAAPVGKFVFNSEAGKEVAASATDAAKKELPSILPGWTGGFMGTSLKSALARDAVGTGLGAAGSFVAVNPWETNSATGQNYTLGETLTSAAEWGVGTGAAFAGIRYPVAGLGMAYRAATNALPGEGSTVARFMGNNLVASSERFVAGGTMGFAGNLTFNDQKDANGNEYTLGQKLGNALESGLITGTGLAAAPFAYSGLKYVAKPVLNPIGDAANAGRRFLGRTAENAGALINNGVSSVAGEGTIIGNNIIAPVSQVSAKVSAVTGDATKRFGPGTKQYLLSHSLQVSTSLSGFYEHNKLQNLDDAANKRADEIRKNGDSDQ